MAQTLVFNDIDVELQIDTSTGTNDLRVTGIEGQKVVAALRQSKKNIPTLKKVVWDIPGGGIVGRMTVWMDSTPRIVYFNFSNLVLPSPNYYLTFVNGSVTEQELRFLDGIKDALLVFNGTHVLTAVSGVSVQPESLWDNLASYYPMEELSGTRYDSYGSTNLLATGSVGYGSSGKHNNYAEFPAAGGSQLSRAVLFSGDKSISLWVNFIPFVTGSQSIFYTGSPATSLIRLGTTLRLSTGAGNTDVSFTFTPGVWYHIVYRLNDSGDIATVYINGALIITAVNTEVDTSFFIDSDADAAMGIDEIAIYSTVISTQQIADLYHDGVGRFL